LRDAGGELAADGTAVSAVGGVTPGDDGAVVFECREGAVGGEELRDTGLEISADGTAVTA
jgi:hypothetical protein